jgi:hypothetical protein
VPKVAFNQPLTIQSAKSAQWNSRLGWTHAYL